MSTIAVTEPYGPFTPPHRPVSLPPLAASTEIGSLLGDSSVYLRPDFRVRYALVHLRALGHGSAPVLDLDGCPVGWVSLRDMEAAVATADEPNIPLVRDLLHLDVIVAHQDEDVAAVVGGLTAPTPPLVAVVDSDGVLVGSIAVLDLIRWVARATRPEVHVSPAATGGSFS